MSNKADRPELLGNQGNATSECQNSRSAKEHNQPTNQGHRACVQSFAEDCVNSERIGFGRCGIIALGVFRCADPCAACEHDMLSMDGQA